VSLVVSDVICEKGEFLGLSRKGAAGSNIINAVAEKGLETLGHALVKVQELAVVAGQIGRGSSQKVENDDNGIRGVRQIPSEGRIGNDGGRIKDGGLGGKRGRIGVNGQGITGLSQGSPACLALSLNVSDNKLGKEGGTVVQVVNFQNEATTARTKGGRDTCLNVKETVLKGAQISGEATGQDLKVYEAVLVLRNRSHLGVHSPPGTGPRIRQIRDKFQSGLIVGTVLVIMNIKVESLYDKCNCLIQKKDD
jgi:hypothetical protein